MELDKLKKRLDRLGKKYESINPRAKLKRMGIQYKMVRLQNKIYNLESVKNETHN